MRCLGTTDGILGAAEQARIQEVRYAEGREIYYITTPWKGLVPRPSRGIRDENCSLG